MKFLRTPAERFQNLSGYEFKPHYVDIDEMRMHYVDEGPADAPPVLLMHGEPSWSYLYRHMIPPIASAGLRAIAPDLIGFGKSDKPAAQSDYSYQTHVAWMLQFLEKLNLKNITLVCQDWGSLIGLRLAAENEERFDRIVLANGGLPTGDQVMPRVFRIWRAFARFSPWFPIGRIVQSGTVSTLPPDVMPRFRIRHTKRGRARFRSWCQPRRMIRQLPQIVLHGKFSANGKNLFSQPSAIATLLRAGLTRRFSNWCRARKINRIRRSEMPDISCRKIRGRNLRRWLSTL